MGVELETLAARSRVSIQVVWASLPNLHCGVSHLGSGSFILGRSVYGKEVSMAQKQWGEVLLVPDHMWTVVWRWLEMG